MNKITIMMLALMIASCGSDAPEINQAKGPRNKDVISDSLTRQGYMKISIEKLLTKVVSINETKISPDSFISELDRLIYLDCNLRVCELTRK